MLEAALRERGLPPAYDRAVDAIHRPLARSLIAARAQLNRPIIFGLCGAQGSGKSTFAAVLRLLLAEAGLSSAVLSLDDLYLTHLERQALARAIHPLLGTRGVPGTHDVAMGIGLLDMLRDSKARRIELPRFDKATDTRAPRSAWEMVVAPVDVVLFEGWCIGATPESDTALAAPINALERDEDRDGTWRCYVNDQLKGSYADLFQRLDLLAFLQSPSFETVFAWRAEQERRLAESLKNRDAQGLRLMDDTALQHFIMHYERLTRHMLSDLPARADFVMPLNQTHEIVALNHRTDKGEQTDS